MQMVVLISMKIYFDYPNITKQKYIKTPIFLHTYRINVLYKLAKNLKEYEK